MSEPLGRDRLGRLVYKWDAGTLVTRSSHYKLFVVGVNSDGDVMMQEDAVWWHTVPHDWVSSHFTVDLAASPKRTIFERYFADLGTLNEICRLTMDICHSYSDAECGDGDCVFDEWSDTKCNVAFYEWLQQEATV